MIYNIWLFQLQSIMPNSQAQAELSLILEYFDLSLKDFLLKENFSEVLLSSIQSLITKRINSRMPIQYILGQAYFMNEKFLVTSDTLIPRPETELLVEKITSLTGNKILDIGTGSGCIAIMTQKITQKSVTACDISQKALEVAKKNAKNLEARVNFIHSDLFENISEKFDIIVSNPPYIPCGTTLSEEVMKEPSNALFASQNGLEFYEKIIKDAHIFLNSQGFLAFEVGCDQAFSIKKLLEQNDFTNIQIIKDLAGLDRIIIAQKKK